MPFPDIDPIAFQIGPVAVRWYGIAYAAAFLLGASYITALLKRPALWGGEFKPGLADQMDNLILYVIAGVIAGGRLGHVLLYESGYYLAEPLKILAFWEGGMSFHGGLIGTVVAILLFARVHQIDKWVVGDLVAACTPFGIILVRLANFVNGEIVGSPSNLPWAMVFPGFDEPRHPAMLYEAALEGVLLSVIVTYCVFRLRTLRFPGLTAGIFLTGYALARIFCEFFKFADHRMIWADLPITKGMAYSLPMLAIGAWLIVSRLRALKQAGAAPSP